MSEFSTVPDCRAEASLPETARVLELEGRRIVLVGTAHVSRRSVEEVRQVIETERPETVCVELDEQRLRTLLDPEQWKRTDVLAVVRQGKALFLLSSLLMASIQRRIGRQLGVQPGAELQEAVEAARDVGSRVELIDRDIRVTLRRAWSRFGLWERLKVSVQILGGVLSAEELDVEAVEALKRNETLGDAMELLAREFPGVKDVLIDERDRYMAEKIRRAPGRTVVAVLGMGHLPGVTAALSASDTNLEPLEQTPQPSRWTRWLQWGIPAAILAMLAAGFFTGGAANSWENIGIWFFVNGGLAAVGAALALGHPVAILSAFLAAPFTSLNPMVAAGWVAGLVQAVIKRPQVGDLESLPDAITSLRGFWTNAVTRILLVVAFANLGSMLGTFLAGGWIATRLVQ